jgi:hypothetical protein
MESRKDEPRAIYFPESKTGVVFPKAASDFECSVHFPMPLHMEDVLFFPVTVELKPKGGD